MVEWQEITEQLIQEHPIPVATLRAATIAAWDDIFRSSVGSLRIGRDIYPQPQIIGFFLHELIPVEIGKLQAGWKRGNPPQKDCHSDAQPQFDFEIKTSSHPKAIFANRSYAQPATAGKAEKAGYYLAVNFGRFAGDALPKLARIRFGWLDHSDWIGQKSETGQQAHLTGDADHYKLLDI